MVNFKNIALAVSVLLGCGLAAPAAEAGAIIPGSYIITLKPEVDAVMAKTHLKWVKGVHKRSLTKRETEVGVEKTYDSKSGFQGYAGSFDTETIKEIKKSPDVSRALAVRRQYLDEQTS
jgi:hypothetical protein